MMQYLPELLLVAGIHLLAVISPGPDFAMICKNSLVYSRRTGVYSALGLGLGIVVHVSASLLGIGFLISTSVFLYTLVKYLGAGYLIYIGIGALRARPRSVETDEERKHTKDLKGGQAIATGFLTNVLNPKAILFFLALFTQVIQPGTPLQVKLIYGDGAEMSIMTSLWFSFVAVILSHQAIQALFRRQMVLFERIFGAILIAFGVKVAFSSRT